MEIVNSRTKGRERKSIERNFWFSKASVVMHQWMENEKRTKSKKLHNKDNMIMAKRDEYGLRGGKSTNVRGKNIELVYSRKQSDSKYNK